MSVKARVAPEMKIATGPQWLRLAKPETIYFSNDQRIGR
jgi:glycerol transport system ATP-binding protein